MALYKGIEFPDHVAPLARHMAALADHREALAALGARWDTLDLLVRLANLPADLSEVRADFGRLADDLLRCMAGETLARSRRALGRRAQAGADLLARRLAAREAGAAVLARDPDVVQACVAGSAWRFDDLRQRLRAWAGLVEDARDIVLLAADGRVLVRLHDGFAGRSASTIVARALSEPGGVVAHESVDFLGRGHPLVHARRVEHQGRVVGVLALEFDLAHAARAIFDRLAVEDELLAFVDDQGRAAASNDAARLPVGRRIRQRPDDVSARLGGVSHLVAHAFPRRDGLPGWPLVALSPVELAFAPVGAPGVAAEFSGETIFPPGLLAIPPQVRALQRRLDRLVWNGRVRQAATSNALSRPLLEAIALAGHQGRDAFERAAADLRATSTAGLLDEARDRARLAADLLDDHLRDLAADVRWWAAHPSLAALDPGPARETLAELRAHSPDCAEAVLFDAGGHVLAAGHDARIEGRTLTEVWVAECLSLHDPQDHLATPFEASPLYGGHGTWVLAAPVIADGRAVGGLGLVFDAAPRLAALLRESLPRMPGGVAAFCRADAALLGRTEELPVTLTADVLGLAPGQSWSGVVQEDGECFVVGAAAGDGDETVIALVVVPCGTPASRERHDAPRIERVEGGVEVATFMIGGQLLGVPASEVAECIEVAAPMRVWRGGFAQRHTGFVDWNGRTLPLLDIAADVNAGHAPHRHAIVMRSGEQWFGLLVSELGPVTGMQLTGDRIQDGPSLISQLGRAGAVMMPVLSPDAVFGTMSA